MEVKEPKFQNQAEGVSTPLGLNLAKIKTETEKTGSQSQWEQIFKAMRHHILHF